MTSSKQQQQDVLKTQECSILTSNLYPFVDSALM